MMHVLVVSLLLSGLRFGSATAAAGSSLIRQESEVVGAVEGGDEISSDSLAEVHLHPGRRQEDPCRTLGCNRNKCDWITGERVRKVNSKKACKNARRVMAFGDKKIETLTQCVRLVKEEVKKKQALPAKSKKEKQQDLNEASNEKDVAKAEPKNKQVVEIIEAPATMRIEAVEGEEKKKQGLDPEEKKKNDVITKVTGLNPEEDDDDDDDDADEKEEAELKWGQKKEQNVIKVLPTKGIKGTRKQLIQHQDTDHDPHQDLKVPRPALVEDEPVKCGAFFQMHKDSFECSCLPEEHQCEEVDDEHTCRFELVTY